MPKLYYINMAKLSTFIVQRKYSSPENVIIKKKSRYSQTYILYLLIIYIFYTIRVIFLRDSCRTLHM